MNKTKIIATIGPSSLSKDILSSLISNGADVIRVNMAHADTKYLKKVSDMLDEVNSELDTCIPILMDTEGPKIRLGKVKGNEVFLKEESKISIYAEDLEGDEERLCVNYKDFIKDVPISALIKLNDGKVILEVLEKANNNLFCVVKKGGTVKTNQGVNVPSVNFNLPFLSEKDKEDIKFASSNNISFLALSFVKSSEDILLANDLLIELDNDHMTVISKIETESAVLELDDILAVSDGIMIARGDLGVEVPLERVPGIQKMAINKCHAIGKISIVATEMMASMENSSTPTRAEVSDVANAVLDGTDAVMLSGETTVGHFPVETLSVMEKVIKNAELDINYLDFLSRSMRTEKQDITGGVAYSVAEVATRLKCGAIFAPTISGYTARKMSRFRPICPIVAISPDIETVKSLALNFAVQPLLVEELKSFDRMIKKSKDIALDRLELEEGDKIIVTGGYPFKEVKHTNFMKIEEL